VQLSLVAVHVAAEGAYALAAPAVPTLGGFLTVRFGSHAVADASVKARSDAAAFRLNGVRRPVWRESRR
jgi:hypothetical protein